MADEPTKEEMDGLGTDTETAPPAKPAAPAQPEPEPEPGPDADEAFADEEEGDDEFTLDALEERVAAGTRRTIEEIRAEEARKAEEAKLSPEVRAIREENARLKAENERVHAESLIAEFRANEARYNHEIDSAVGKFHATVAERDDAIRYFEANPDLVGHMSFERALLRVHPEIRDRLKTPESAARGIGRPRSDLSTPAANGAGAPKPFKHTAKPGNYDDITRHTLESGEAAQLGSYT